MPIHTGRLLLSSQNPFLAPDASFLAAALTEAGFLGIPLAGRKGAFALGDQFLQLVTFAGCSVQVELYPNSDSPFCHIRIVGPFELPVFQSGRNTRPPRCPNCRTPLRDWKRALAAWDGSQPEPIACTTCGEAGPPWTYDWKEKAGFGRLFIQVEEVFPGEAVPTPGLMDLLADSSSGEWRYFYIQDA